MRLAPRLPLALLALALVAGCVDSPADDVAPATADDPLPQIFEEAAAEFDVPSVLLKSIGYTETGWQMVEGEEEFEGVAPAFGVMALRGDRLTRGASLAQVAERDARTDPRANIRAAAALLNHWADEASIERSSLEAWEPVVARYSGIEVEDARASYVREGVYRTVERGATVEVDGVSVGRIEATPVRLTPATAAVQQQSTDYGPAIYRQSPNFSSRPSGVTPGMVIVHTCEGSYAGCWGWLANSQSGVSAHYVVNTTGSEITQLVRESKKAWHIGASYSCSNNNGVDCFRNGTSSNNFTIGLEHAGYASQSSFNTGMIQASAELSCSISQKYNIARDRYHIVGHGQLQPYNRTDPGPNWPWTDYLNRINAACGAPPTGGGEIIIDSNNSLNNTSEGYIQTSSNWNSSSNAQDYQTGYWWAQTASVSDGATFWFYLRNGGTRTLDAWWVAGSNRASSAPFLVYNASGTRLATVRKDMRSSGGRWNTLGTYSFTPGWNRVVLSRWTTPGSVVIADAMRVR